MTEKETIKELRALWDDKEKPDMEIIHVEADKILCKFLKAQGYPVIVKLFEKLPKWYS